MGNWLNAAASLGETEKLGDEITRFRAKAAGTPEVDALNWLLLSAKHDDGAALAAAESDLVRLPYNCESLYERAASLTRLGQYEKALTNAQAALEQRPFFSKAAALEAALLTKLGRKKECIAFLADFGKRYPALARARLNIDASGHATSAQARRMAAQASRQALRHHGAIAPTVAGPPFSTRTPR